MKKFKQCSKPYSMCQQKVGISTSSLQTKWIDSIDPLLDYYFGKKLPTRDELGFSDKLSLTNKLKIMGLRLAHIKEQMVEGDLKVPFEVEPRRRQSKLTAFSPSLAKEKLVGAKAPEECSKPPATTPKTSMAGWNRRRLVDFSGSSPLKRHRLEVRLNQICIAGLNPCFFSCINKVS